MKPWAGYVRVSHVGGRGGDRFHSPTEQADQIRRWAKARGERIKVLAPELDQSGGRDDRPILTEAVEGIEAGKYRGLVVAYLSRASRSVSHLLALWDRIEAAGGQVVAVAENVDTSTPAGRLTRTMLAAIAEHELDLHRERFADLRESATRRGIWQRRQTPLGYRRDPDTRQLVPDEDAGKVCKAFSTRASGESISAIARTIGLTQSGARHLLRNRVYLGELHVGAHSNLTAHPPLIDRALWDEVQAVRTVRPPRSTGPVALLAGLVRCSSCGHVMSRSTGGVRSYACHRQHSAGRCPSPAAILLDTLDAHVETIALRELDRLTFTVHEDREAIDRARDAVVEAEAELAAYLEATSAAGLGADQFAKGATARRQALDTVRDELGALLERGQATIIGEPREAWAGLDRGQRNRLLRGLIEAVVVMPVGRGRRVPVAERARVVRHGAGLIGSYPGGGAAMAVGPLPALDLDHPAVLGLPLGQDGLEHPGG